MALAPAGESIVHYALTPNDVMVISGELTRTSPGRPPQNAVELGEIYPAVITSITGTAPRVAHLVVFLNGPDQFWAPGREEGTTVGTWSVPQP